MCPKIRATACILYLLGDTRVYSRYSSKACGKTFIKKNTWNIFQYSALFETFQTCNIFPLFIKSNILFSLKGRNTLGKKCVQKLGPLHAFYTYWATPGLLHRLKEYNFFFFYGVSNIVVCYVRSWENS